MSTTNVSTTTATLYAVAALAADRLQPPPRAAATSATLRQMGDLINDAAHSTDLPPMIAGDLAAALTIVGEPHPDDAPPVAARRATCRELAALAAEVQAERKAAGVIDFAGEPRSVAAVWNAVAAKLQADDPRQAAIAATLRREAAEIEERCPYASLAEIVAAAEYIAGSPKRCDVHVNKSGRYLLAVWSWADDELRTLGLDCIREVTRLGGVDLPAPLRLRMRDAQTFATALAARGVRVNDHESIDIVLKRVFGT